MPRHRIVAAGLVVLDRSKGPGPRVLLVHRPAYDDWTLPKGKIHPDEYLVSCAQRETLEETGVTASVEMPLGKVEYQVGGGDKVVHYWVGRPQGQKKRKPDKEVDRVVWLTVKSALHRMTYGDERMMVDRAVEATETTPVLVVRHAKAMDRKHWSGRDQGRPITGRGRKQSRRLIPLLDAYGVTALASSSSNRCVQTLKPYSKSSGHEIETWAALSEEQAKDNEKGVRQVMKRLQHDALKARTPLAVCGHRPVLPAMLESLDVPVRAMQTAAVAVAHLDPDGNTVAVEWHRPRV